MLAFSKRLQVNTCIVRNASHYLQSGGRNSFNLSAFRLQDLGIDFEVRMAGWIRSIDFYNDLAEWTSVEMVEGIG